MKIFIIIFGLILAFQPLDGVPVCTTLNGIYRTFPNIWEVYSEFKATGVLWMPVAMNACPENLGDGFRSANSLGSSTGVNHHAEKSNSVYHEEPHRGHNQDFMQSPFSSHRNHNADHNEHASPPTAGHCNKIQQPQSIPNYPEPIKPWENGKFNRNSEIIDNLAISRSSNQHEGHDQAEHTSFQSHSDHPLQSGNTKHSSPSNHGPSSPITRGPSSAEQPQYLPNFPEPANAQFNENSRHWVNSNPSVVQSQDDQPWLSSHPSFPNDGSSLPAAKHHSSNPQLQHLTNYPEHMQPPSHHHNPAHLPTGLGNSPCSQNPNPPYYGSPYLSHHNGPLIHSEGHSVQQPPYHSLIDSENRHNPAQHHPLQISINHDNFAEFPERMLPPLGRAEANTHSRTDPNFRGQSNRSGNFGRAADIKSCGNAQTCILHALESQRSQISARSRSNISDNRNSQQQHTANGRNLKAQNEGQTIYNGAVYQGPYYYEPKYNHIYVGSFSSPPLPALHSLILANKGSSENSNIAIPGAAEHRMHSFKPLLGQLKYITSRNGQSGY